MTATPESCKLSLNGKSERNRAAINRSILNEEEIYEIIDLIEEETYIGEAWGELEVQYRDFNKTKERIREILKRIGGIEE